MPVGGTKDPATWYRPQENRRVCRSGAGVSMSARAVDEIDAHVGRRIRYRRMSLGLSQDGLARALGLTFQQVQKYEKGQNRIGAGRLYQIALELTVPVEFFYEGLPSSGDAQERRHAAAARADMDVFLSSAEGHALSHAFQRITDPATRRRIVELVDTIAASNA